jgi:RNA-binding protein 39
VLLVAVLQGVRKEKRRSSRDGSGERRRGDRDRDEKRRRRSSRSRSRDRRRRSSRSRSPRDRRRRSRSPRERERQPYRRSDAPRFRREVTPPEVRAERAAAAEFEALDRDVRTVFAYNLSLKAEEKDIFQFFARAGPVNDIKVITDKNTGRSKGFAYIEFQRREDVINSLALTGQVRAGGAGLGGCGWGGGAWRDGRAAVHRLGIWLADWRAGKKE